MADVKIHDDVVIGGDLRDEGEHCACRRGETLVFGVRGKDMDAFALVIIFRRETRMLLSRQGTTVHQRRVAIVAPGEHLEHGAA